MCPSTTIKALLLLAVVVIAFASTSTHAAVSTRPLPRSLGTHGNVSAGCSPLERDALLAFKRGITKDPASLLASWRLDDDGGAHQKDEDCCRWRGVWCSDQTGHVVGLDLRNVGVDHYYVGIDQDYHYNNYQQTALIGEISPPLLNLHHLEYLDLSHNAVQGPTGRVPDFLGSLKTLRYLNLSCVPFFGRVSPYLGNLTNLYYLDMSGTIDSIGINSINLSWLACLHSLIYLDMSYTDLGQVHDWVGLVNNIPSLKVLRLANCGLTHVNQTVSHFNLTNLEELDLSNNYFDHPFASCWFWNTERLKHLNLDFTYLYGQLPRFWKPKGLEYLSLMGTQLDGRFPDSLGQLTSLQILDLTSVSYMDIMTANMTNLCNLRILHLGDTQINGDIVELLEILPRCSLNRLNELYLYDNNITGVLPNHLDHLTALVILDIAMNKLSGPVPHEIGMLGNLTYLDLGDNNLDGVITDKHFANMRSLKTLGLSDNSLRILVNSEWLPPFSLEVAMLASCHMGPLFPSWLKGQVNITYLDISFAGITDRLPDWFSTTFSNTHQLNASNNGINGSLPANMEVMTTLDQLYLNSNKLTGQIPVLPKRLAVMDISMNSLSGPLPSNFRAPTLIVLSLFSNRITGHIPQSMCELQNLQVLDLADNLLEGEFPHCLFQLKYIATLVVNNNFLFGKFPPFLHSSTRLQILDLTSNNFYGELPLWIGELSGLQILRLSHNNFSASIPTTITNLTQLLHLDLSSNCISGVLPLHLSNLTSMRADSMFQSSGFKQDFPVVNVSVDTKGQKLYYEKSAAFDMVTVDFSLNYLTGGIPEEIVFLDIIKNLNLSLNQFSGSIPSNIGVMRSLESLDLSENNLSGEIPSSLSNLTYLSHLDLSYNHLTGRIPSGGQLDTLYMENPSIYNGNNGLCGYPLKNCSNNSNAPKHGMEKTSEGVSDPMFLYFGLGSGFVIGLWVVFCTILFKKAWRIAYFHLFNELYDKVYVFVVVTWGSLSIKSGTR